MLPAQFLGPVQRPISSGIIVRISGSTPTNAKFFNVNLQCGPLVNPRDDVAFHLSINFNGLTIVTNSIFDNQWGPPEICTGQFPFQRGREFSIDITCEQSAFLVIVNGITTARFEHRVEPSRISHLAIDGDVILRNVELLGGTQLPVRFAVPPNTLSSAGMPPMPPYHPSTINYHSSGDVGPTPFPVGWLSNPTHPPATYMQQLAPYPQQSTPYPLQPGTNPGQPGPYQQQPGPYPQLPGLYSQKTAPYPQQSVKNLSQAPPYPQQPGLGAPVFPVPTSSKLKQNRFLDRVGLGSLGGVVGGAASGVLGMKGAKKLGKLAKKAREKAVKFGLPVAGVGLGALTIKKSSHGRGHSSSSSSSSD